MPKRLRELYYIAHQDNLPSIFAKGILSHAGVEREGVEFTRVYDEGIVAWRKSKSTPAGRSLWEYANLYFQPRNPMLYRLVMEGRLGDLAILSVDKSVLEQEGVFITTGNAARNETLILPRREWAKHSEEILRAAALTWWSDTDGSKRKIMAEVLVPDTVPPEFIKAVYVPDNDARQRVASLLQNTSRKQVPIIPEPQMFFQPQRVIRLTATLRLVEGDMFFSTLQTLTISVNTVGVMGKGLASRAKYQFPDAYVRYQDACKRGWLRPGKPYLYKREASLDLALADEPAMLTNANRQTWFLFFPTKRHWRERSRLDDIEKGLQWIEQNYRSEGIKSLAMPALGCGLGGLDWAVVGPLMVRYLSRLDMPVDIHLPLEGKVPDEQLKREFLLRDAA